MPIGMGQPFTDDYNALDGWPKVKPAVARDMQKMNVFIHEQTEKIMLAPEKDKDGSDAEEKPAGSEHEGEEPHTNARLLSGLRNIRNHRKQYVLSLVSQHNLVVGVVSSLSNYDPKAEFDPFLLERIKNCLRQLHEKAFISGL